MTGKNVARKTSTKQMNNMVVVTSQKKSKALKYYYHEGQSSYIVFPVTIKSEVWFTATSFCPHLATHPPLFRCTVTLRPLRPFLWRRSGATLPPLPPRLREASVAAPAVPQNLARSMWLSSAAFTAGGKAWRVS